ncbi:MAG: UDP-N-acetylmuramoyl-L-alanine--D-glutamate ligase [Candidatus Auribacterota bacterium]|nr:UDP-N-acetylmuramoyl-L-alanine--D-glutamate ligase [Candidatus Auribacterota bacterium]
MNIDRKKVLVLGLGLSGAAAAELLLNRGAVVEVIDDGNGEGMKKRAEELRDRGAEVLLGGKEPLDIGAFDLLVISPGIPLSHRVARMARERDIPVIGELELAYRLLKTPLIAVTGTNGKTTTVSLLSEIFRRGSIPSVTGGNIGYPLSRIVLDNDEKTVVVAEVSSFQLETMEKLSPAVAVLLNLSPDHLDRYGDMASYRAAKLRLFQNQGSGDRAGVPEDLRPLLKSVLDPEVEIMTWGKGSEREGAVREEEGILRIVRSGKKAEICRIDEIALPGRHNLRNVMAAVSIANIYGIELDSIKSALISFRGLPHRLEYVSSPGGVPYYNDSKATNPGAVRAALRSFSRPVIWLAGGSEKGLDFSLLRDEIKDSVKMAILMGESRNKLKRLVEGVIPFRMVSDMEEAVDTASREAEAGDPVLLSPGYASFDMFKNYKERGKFFKSLVKEM